jgi:hypothetical protein
VTARWSGPHIDGPASYGQRGCSDGESRGLRQLVRNRGSGTDEDVPHGRAYRELHARDGEGRRLTRIVRQRMSSCCSGKASGANPRTCWRGSVLSEAGTCSVSLTRNCT